MLVPRTTGFAAGFTDPLTQFFSSELTASGIDGWETSAARAKSGNVVFYTGNWFAALSTDGGTTFTRVNPWDMPGIGVHEVFCCDQQVDYVPSIDRFVWIRQTINLFSDFGANRYRISVASPADLESSHGTKWTSWDLTPLTFGFPAGTWFDFPQVTFDTHYLLLSFNVIHGGFGAVVRIPLGVLGGKKPFTADYFTDPTGPSWDFRIAKQTIGSAFFARLLDTSTLRVYRWRDGAPKATYADIPISTVSSTFDETTPSGVKWLAPGDKTYPQVLGAAEAGVNVWFAWHSGSDSFFPHAHIELITVDQNLVPGAESYIWSSDWAWAFPDLASNSHGEVGMAFEYGGGTKEIHSGVGILTNTQQFASGSINGVGGGGHYMTIHRDYRYGALFDAAVYYTHVDAGTAVNHPQFIVFGRSGDAPPQPGPVRPAPPMIATSQLTLTCPAQARIAQPASFSGTLTPPAAGSPVSLTYTRPDGSTVNQATVTDANGSYSTSLVSDRFGTWTARAHFGGDSGRTPADSQSCSFTVTQ